MSPPSTKSLRLALRLNAAFSTLSALVLGVGHGEWAPLLGVDARLLIGVAVGLGLFAIQLAYTASRRDLPKLHAEARWHSMADFAWVIASIGVIAGGWLTPLGNALLAAVGVPVLALGIAQFRSLPARSNAPETAI